MRFATSDEPPTLTNGSVMPGHRRHAGRHADVDEDLEQKGEDDAGGGDRGERVAGDRDDLQASPDDEQIEQQEDRRADEPALLRERGEREVGRVLGQVVEPRLCRLVDAATGEPAGADGRDRLALVPRRALRILVGVEEAGQAVGLVRLQHLDADSRQDPERRDTATSMSAASTPRCTQRTPATKRQAPSAAR